MKILNLKPFVKIIDDNVIGIAKQDSTFSSTAWHISDEAFNAVRGNKFVWYAPDGNEYTDIKTIMTRPTEQDVIDNISEPLKAKAVELGYIEL